MAAFGNIAKELENYLERRVKSHSDKQKKMMAEGFAALARQRDAAVARAKEADFNLLAETEKVSRETARAEAAETRAEVAEAAVKKLQQDAMLSKAALEASTTAALKREREAVSRILQTEEEDTEAAYMAAKGAQGSAAPPLPAATDALPNLSAQLKKSKTELEEVKQKMRNISKTKTAILTSIEAQMKYGFRDKIKSVRAVAEDTPEFMNGILQLEITVLQELIKSRRQLKDIEKGRATAAADGGWSMDNGGEVCGKFDEAMLISNFELRF